MLKITIKCTHYKFKTTKSKEGNRGVAILATPYVVYTAVRRIIIASCHELLLYDQCSLVKFLLFMVFWGGGRGPTILQLADLSILPNIPFYAYIALVLFYRCSQVTDLGLGFLSTMTSLQRLYLRWCCQLRDFGLQHVYIMSSLQVLSLAGTCRWYVM